ncbi:alpha/beta hydrolase [Halobaculum sp. D14]|uniref:alpha/beta hydrolase n=1 Tax=Halobaculum sp. D14 TaxID=3421642 RepID=UPI003EBDFA24
MTVSRSRGENRPSREAFATRRVTVPVDGSDAECAATLYLPADADDPPAVVMAPPFAAEASFGLPRFAERFAAAGYAALTVDYRGIGRSASGRDAASARDAPAVIPDRQCDDVAAAADFAAGHDDVGDDLVLWGASLAGGYAVSVAADRYDVDAVVAQTPIPDGGLLGGGDSLRSRLRAAAAGLRDRIGGLVGRPHHVKVYGDPDEFAVLNAPGAKDGYVRLIPRESTWQNRTPARGLSALRGYRAVADADAVRCPAFVVAAADDAVVPAESTEAFVDALADPTVLRRPMNHFDAFHDDFEAIVRHQLAFLDATL